MISSRSSALATSPVASLAQFVGYSPMGERYGWLT
jgi:hypothetical protein